MNLGKSRVIVLDLDYVKSTPTAKSLNHNQRIAYYQESLNILSWVIRDYNGVIWKYTGDGFLVRFTTESISNVDAAFMCGTRLIAVANRVLKTKLALNGISDFAVKVAIDIGELSIISLEPQPGKIIIDCVGEIVNRVCRICSVAEKGNILVGSNYYNLLHYSYQNMFVQSNVIAKDYGNYLLYSWRSAHNGERS